MKWYAEQYASSVTSRLYVQQIPNCSLFSPFHQTTLQYRNVRHWKIFNIIQWKLSVSSKTLKNIRRYKTIPYTKQLLYTIGVRTSYGWRTNTIPLFVIAIIRLFIRTQAWTRTLSFFKQRLRCIVVVLLYTVK